MEDTTGERLPMKIAEGLYPFAEGPYAHYFNGENNINYSLDYVVLELENLSVKDVRLQTAIITSLITQILVGVLLSLEHEGRQRRGSRKAKDTVH
ncbi:MAG: hypothetical protein Q9N34_03420 [Aquificota bacterium]|nr:hypothetical protein [Aquificota bacterium]